MRDDDGYVCLMVELMGEYNYRYDHVYLWI